MKKSTIKRDKLSLNRETLRALEGTEIGAIVGGETWQACTSFSCNDCFSRNTCTTDRC